LHHLAPFFAATKSILFILFILSVLVPTAAFNPFDPVPPGTPILPSVFFAPHSQFFIQIVRPNPTQSE
jgi:hypothetical protein